LNESNEFDAYKVAVGSIHLTLQNVLSTLIGVLGLAFLARMITQEEMGIVAALSLLISLVHMSSDFGLSASLAKFVSELTGKGEDVSTHVLSCLSFRLLISSLAAFIVFLFSRSISAALFETDFYSDLIGLSALDSIFLSVTSILNSAFWGSGKLRDIALYGVSSTAVRWLLVVAFLYSDYGINGVVLGWICGDAVLFLLYLLSGLRMVTFTRSLFFNARRYLPSLLRFSWPLFIASVVSFIYGWYDKALVLAYLPLADLGIYDMSYRAFSVLMSIAAALGSALFPYYGMAYGRKDHAAITLGIRRASKYTMITIFPLSMGLFATSKPVMTLFAGQQYEPGWPVLATLSLFGLVSGLSSAFSNLLLIYEKTKTVMALSFISVILSLSLFPLLWVLDLAGLAVIRGVSLLLSFTLSVYSLSKILKVEIDKQTLIKTLAASVLMAVAVMAVQELHYSKFLLPFYVLVGASVYASSLRLMKVLDLSDLELLRKILGERIARYVVVALGYTETLTEDPASLSSSRP